ncbi:PBSX family phage terminase large subunit [Bradyrhizobium manausense]|uniref:PBSX family phage terminase large subunit n=1 Tax=Bradyrhizobium manausense TaxID=989370 RepID=UPI001BACF8F6|nr:PBSX family phage terminase large subunit [Bradyrhizobium manausense]MBR0721774.1 PBSX family phage terminase large subunit [Bradyrhizobium manausense]
MNRIEIPEKFAGLFEPHRYKVFHGGRGSGKSWSVARALVHLAARKPLRVVCAREFQNSIEESVHQLLKDQIELFNLPYDVGKYSITNNIGSEFIFKGLSKQDAAAVKSLEGADICWVEEAQAVSEGSWKNLTPTVRKDGSEIWVTFNPDLEDDPTYQRFVIRQPTNAHVVEVNFYDNPWFPAVLEQERLDMLKYDPVGYENVWLGKPRTFAEGAIFRREIEAMGERIGLVPHDPNKPVYAIFDLGHAASGRGDPHAIIFAQAGTGSTYNLIDYWEDNNATLPDVISNVMLAKPYRYAKVIIPHDGARVNSHTGKTDAELFEDQGLQVELLERTPSLDKDMNNIRVIFPQLVVDAEKCKGLLAALRGHRRERNEKTGIWNFRHDWTSHGVAAARYLAVYINMTGGLSPRLSANDNHTPRRMVAC